VQTAPIGAAIQAAAATSLRTSEPQGRQRTAAVPEGEPVLRTLQRERALYEIAQALAENLDEARVLELTVAHASNLLNAEYARVWLYQPDGQLGCAAAQGFVHAQTLERRLNPDSVSGLAARGDLLNLSDAPGDAAWRVSRDFGDRTGLGAYLGAAIRRAGESLGVLEVMRAPEQPFGPADEQLLLSLASAVAVAVSNARQAANLRALAADNARLYRKAREALRIRDRFLAVAAHELRGPLARLKLQAELVMDLVVDEAADRPSVEGAAVGLNTSIDRLSRLTSDLLTISRLRRPDSLRRQLIDAAALVRTAADAATPQLTDAHWFVFELPTAPVMIRADADRLEQVLMNVLENAVKYSPAGGPIAVRLVVESDGVVVSVQDQGIGIPADAITHMFEPFARASNAAVLEVPGLGLGLHICRQIVTRHGGRMWATSDGQGTGTTVAIWLPLKRHSQRRTHTAD
jgi:signal transduction histidine kinase